MKANLLWYVPLCVVVLGFVFFVNGSTDLRYVQLVVRRWTWGALLSPSSYVFGASLMGTIVYPLAALAAIPKFFDISRPSYNKRYQITALAVAVIFGVSILLEFVGWGSFPLDVDAERMIHLRLIPFLPWPDRPF